jgi:hypothetical protein
MDIGLPRSEIRPGDVIFLTPGPDDPIAKWIAEADSGIFSHAAIAYDQDHLINAALRGFEAGRDLDTGGILVSPIADELDREGPIFVGRPALDPSNALERANRFVEMEGSHPDHKSGFSAAKSLLMMAALCAAHSNDQKLRELVLRAGRLWSVEAEIEQDEIPSFICAEFVVYCYNRPFTWGDLHEALRLGERSADGPEVPLRESPAPRIGRTSRQVGASPSLGLAGDPQVLWKCLDSALGVWRELKEVADHTPRQMAALAHVALHMEVHHPSFLNQCLGSGVKLAWEVLTNGDADGPPEGEGHNEGPIDTDPQDPVVDDRVIPACLVTPRTLANASWLEWVRPVEQSGSSRPAAREPVRLD